MTTQAGARLTTLQLRKLAEEFLWDNFQMKLRIPIRISNRMKSTLGVFKFYRKSRKPFEIALSGELVANQPRDVVIDVLYHECVHYALFMQGLPHSDGDREFKDTVDRLGVSRTRTFRYKGTAHLYECKDCDQRFTRKMKGYEKRYMCGRCKGNFQYLGTVKV